MFMNSKERLRTVKPFSIYIDALLFNCSTVRKHIKVPMNPPDIRKSGGFEGSIIFHGTVEHTMSISTISLINLDFDRKKQLC